MGPAMTEVRGSLGFWERRGPPQVCAGGTSGGRPPQSLSPAAVGSAVPPGSQPSARAHWTESEAPHALSVPSPPCPGAPERVPGLSPFPEAPEGTRPPSVSLASLPRGQEGAGVLPCR